MKPILILLLFFSSQIAFAGSVQSVRLNDDGHLIANGRSGSSENISIKGHVRLSKAGALACNGSELTITSMNENDVIGSVGSWDSTSGTLTIAEDGLYSFLGHFAHEGGTDGQTIYAIIEVNGSNRLLFPSGNTTGATINSKPISGVLKLNKNDLVQFEMNCIGTIKASGETFISITRID